MALKGDSNKTTTTARETTSRKGPAVLGYVNIGINTNKPGEVRRVESIRLMEGNALHEVIFQGLNAEREGDPTFDTTGKTDKEIAKLEEDRKALLAERLAGFVSKLNVSFNPSRTEADSELITF